MTTDRRDFLRQSAGLGLGAAAATALSGVAGLPAATIRRRARRPVAVGSANALDAVRLALERLAAGDETVEAVVAGVNLVEEDPADMSVGYGGLPNEHGVVQLDASVMHGPTRGAGAVGALEGVRTPSRVALAVMRYTDHIFLVGEGARAFARQMGFDADQELLTDEARRRWLEWRARLSGEDDWLTPEESGERVEGFAYDSWDGVRPMGTINCNVVDAAGDMAGVTTTSGLFFKIPGRVGDSPIIGAGLYVDNDVGACGSTGRGEAVIKVCGSHTVVEAMRGGASPTDACLEALRRIVRFTVEPRLLNAQGRPDFNVNFYAVNKAGEYGGAAIWSGSRFAVNVDGDARLEDSAYLFQRG